MTPSLRAGGDHACRARGCGCRRHSRSRGLALLAALALTLALLGPSAATPARTPTRRRVSDISCALAGTRPDYYQRQAALLCANVTPAVFPGGFAPACCTVTALECAKRCSASPDCLAFRFATYADSPPVPTDAPPGALPAGATWHACELHRSVALETCATQLQLHYAATDALATTPYTPKKLFYEHPVRTGAVYYDAY